MAEPVKPTRRRYDATRRRAAALESRRAIVLAARRLFLERGYAATTMAAIAEAAGVSHETVTAETKSGQIWSEASVANRVSKL